MKKKILVSGSNGFIGNNVLKHLRDKKYDVYGVDITKSDDKKTFTCDLSKKKDTKLVLDKINPDVIIHTVGLRSLKACEEDPKLAKRIDVDTSKNIIDNIKNKKTKLIFISSDYVFDGTKGKYKESDKPDPKTVYGKDKLQVEKIIEDNLDDWAVIRTSNVYGNGGGGFFNFIVDSLRSDEKIDVYKDTYFSPTHVDDIAKSIDKVISKNKTGIFHVAGNSLENRYSFAKKIAKYFGMNGKNLLASKKPKADPAAKNSSLDSKKTQKYLSIKFLTTDEGIKKTIPYFRKIKPYFQKKDDRGQIFGISSNKCWKEINFIESNKGLVRGNHYHKKTQEGFYIISGEIKINIVNKKTNYNEEFIAKKGDIFVIYPYEVHTFKMIKKSSWINMLTVAMDQKSPDIHK